MAQNPDVPGREALELFFAYQQSGEPALLAESIGLFRSAVAAIPADYPDPAMWFNNLGYALHEHFERTGDAGALAEVVRLSRAAAAATPEGDPYLAPYLSNLAAALRELSEETGDAALLAESAQAARDAVAASPADDPGLLKYLGNLKTSLSRLYERTGRVAALAEAVEVSRRAAAASTGDERLERLSSLGEYLRVLFERTGDVDALAESVRMARDVVAATADDNPDRARRATHLCGALTCLYEQTGDTAAMAQAVRAARDAVDAAAADDPGQAGYLCNLVSALETVYERTGDVAALRDAVQAGRAAVAMTPEGHLLRPLCSSALGGALYLLSRRTGDDALLDEAVRADRDALTAAVERQARTIYQHNLSAALDAVFERTGDTAALAEAVQAQREAVAATPGEDPSRADGLHNLGTVLLALAERTGDATALAEAVRAHRDAVAATPPGHPGLGMRLSSLGSAMHSVFEQTGEYAALAEAVQAHRDAVAATPTAHVEHAVRVHSLGTSLLAQARRTDDAAVLAEAVQVFKSALAVVPGDHPVRAMCLNNLGIALHWMFQHLGDGAVLDEAVQAQQDAVAATPADHPDRAGHLSNLSSTLLEQFRCTREPEVLATAVQAARDAVSETPADHPDLAKYLNNLGVALRVLAERTDDAAAFGEAWRCFTRSAGTASAPASARVDAHRRAAAVAERAGRTPDEVLVAVEAAVALLAKVAPGSLARTDREYGLGRVATLAGQAAAAAVAAGRPDRAVELLEQTRGVLVADRLDARGSDLARLRRHAAGLADEFDRLRARIDVLDRPGSSIGTAADGPAGERARAARRADAYAAWDDLVARIRAVDGFEDFLEPPHIGKLAACASDGPVVFAYSSPDRCDALILGGEPNAQVRVVPLGMTEEEAVRRGDRLLDALRAVASGADAAAQAEILEILGWIWDAVAEPVLATLGHAARPAPGAAWPRVWWCPVGVFAYLPLHAAGHHRVPAAGAAADSAGSRAVLDRVVSSYIGTVRGLGYARTPRPSATAAAPLIVAVPDAPDAPPLPAADQEARILAGLLPGADVLAHPTRDAVLAALPGRALVHFACHAQSDWDEPAESRLVLYDHAEAPLTIAEIGARHLVGGLAYLSACETALGSPALANEAVHITGAFHLAGYQQVVGTLWPVNDGVAAAVARGFYRRLTKAGSAPPDVGLASWALHETTRELRDHFPGTPSAWAAHVHTGI